MKKLFRLPQTGFASVLLLCFTSCISLQKTEIQANAKTIQAENYTWPLLPDNNNVVVVHKTDFGIDSADLGRYKLKKQLSIFPETYSKVKQRLQSVNTETFDAFFNKGSSTVNGQESFDAFVAAEIFNLSRQFSEDDNNYRNRYRPGRYQLKKKLQDTGMHIFSKIVLRQDICEGCSGTGFGLDPVGVIHYKLAIVSADKFLFYKEYLIPNYRNKFYTNRRGVEDASNWFTKEAIAVLVNYLKRDLQRLMGG